MTSGTSLDGSIFPKIYIFMDSLPKKVFAKQENKKGHFFTTLFTGHIIDPKVPTPKSLLKALVAGLHSVVRYFHQGVLVEVVPILKVRVHNMDRVDG